jgi:hypothetical protein
VSESGFEYDSDFYPWSISTIGKDLMLIERFARMSLPEFYELVDDGFDLGRPSLLLTMIATSIRAGHPDWSVERISRAVENLELGELHMIDGDQGEPELPPPAAETSTGGKSASPSRSTSSAPTPELSVTSSATPA